ncbi:MAG TPA: hypothetical protein VEC99_11950 [Clostridia bacterium]|nr:hypothetical protein [Clostridia bacterium]
MNVAQHAATLCHDIERLPASPLQTAISLQASEIRKDCERLEQERNDAHQQKQVYMARLNLEHGWFESAFELVARAILPMRLYAEGKPVWDKYQLEKWLEHAHAFLADITHRWSPEEKAWAEAYVELLNDRGRWVIEAGKMRSEIVALKKLIESGKSAAKEETK